MSKRDLSLEHIDVAKLLIYVLAFLLVCMVMIFGFIVPNIKEYKASTKANNSQIASYAKAKHFLDTKAAALDALKQENKYLIEAFSHKFDPAQFSEFASGFFSDVSLHKVDMPAINSQNEPQNAKASGENNAQNSQKSEKDYFVYELSVTSFSDTPSRLYAFLDALSKYPNIIKVEFPIQMRGEGEKIRTRFNIKVYGDI
ncbi:hypothetical protein [Campylobacter sp. 19-13652]|uniref:hypothetical protein n=1 Tax=Campylobacter sp. 19-13652 TaxID=2840180 RepID=UPI001C75878B|nr:hypothetical protein [Campylobacter sp. 19-13652]BCX79702.1 hypothetical protein LBC_11640 [Campylobacter sp. 19-13652]